MQKLHLWLPISALTLAVCAAVALHAVWQSPPAPAAPPLQAPRQPVAVGIDLPIASPGESFDLAQQYRSHHIDVAAVPCPDAPPPDGYLFFDGPADPLRVWQAPQSRDYADCWRGVILSRYVPDRRLDDVVLGAWGDCGMRAGPYLLFGDPAWISRSRDVLPQT